MLTSCGGERSLPMGKAPTWTSHLLAHKPDQVLLAHQLPAVPDQGASVSAQDVVLLLHISQQQSHFDRVLLLKYA